MSSLLHSSACRRSRTSLSALKNSNIAMRMCNFIQDCPTTSFLDLLEFVDPGENGENIIRHHNSGSQQHEGYKGRPQKVSIPNQFFMVLIKLRHGVFHQHLGHLFSVSMSTVSRIFSVWVDFIYLQPPELTSWLSRRAIDEAMPLAFVKDPSTHVLLDATEIL
ncbi:hypothetical protein HPB48_021869 [Haemaphysalis longicornis]|uniref:Transposase Helix-turn-helix domain-containing protein n=1 Tax=Haemaphysalis longicornis TaxID=44386 RepID=A0A9J6FN54_HAELO|nr:hypothetical protein HPB48_021869 [Haemaphysalis longicornis]